MIARFNLFDPLIRCSGPVCCGEIHQWRNKVDQVMRNATTFLHRNFGGGDLDSLVNLNGVAVYDLAVKAQGQFDSQRALAGSGGTDYGNDAGGTRLLPEFTGLVLFEISSHPREMISRIAMTNQTSASSMMAPMI